MATPRRQQICLEQTPYYHCISRCVRRAFLCGIDKLTGRSFEHRRALIERRLHELVTIFSIDVAAYAIMSNHYHVILRVDQDATQRWSDAEVIERWGRLFKLPECVQDFARGEALDGESRTQAEQWIATYRARLASISWFMKCLNTNIARAANKEDDCTGRFFEGRFKCQALLDEAALLKCMAYVDLNPVRAKTAESAETATHTSMVRRLSTQPTVLLPFTDDLRPSAEMSERPHWHEPPCIPFTFADYRALVAWTEESPEGRTRKPTPAILRAHDIDRRAWVGIMSRGALSRPRVLGAARRIREFAQAVGQSWLWGETLPS